MINFDSILGDVSRRCCTMLFVRQSWYFVDTGRLPRNGTTLKILVNTHRRNNGNLYDRLQNTISLTDAPCGLPRPPRGDQTSCNSVHNQVVNLTPKFVTQIHLRT